MAGPAGLLWGKARRPFRSLPDQGGTRQPKEAVDREQEWSWPQSLLPAATKGRAPGGLEVAFLGERMAQCGGVPGRAPWPSL